MFGQRRPGYTLLSILLDLLLTIGALVLAIVLRDTLPYGAAIPGPVDVPPPVFVLTLGIWLGTFFAFSVYDPRKNYRFADELQAVIGANLFALFLLAGVLYFTYRDLPRLLIVYFSALTLSFVVSWRIIARIARRLFYQGHFNRPRRVLIIGADELGQQIAGMIREYDWTGLQLVGFLDDTKTHKEVIGSLYDVNEVVRRYNVEEVIVTLPYGAYDRLNDIILKLQALPVQVRIVPNYLNLVLYRATVETFGGMPLINLRDPALTGYQRVVKRAFDLLVGSLLLLISLPIMAGLALAIRLDSPGPIVFRQKRVGENGRLFTMYKLRTMVAGAKDEPGPIQTDELGRIVYKIQDDPRVTAIGRFLRRTSLDELPQLFNVLKGDMSLVGPRPEMPWLVEKYEPWQHKRFAVPQGMTGWWQVNGRSDRPMHLHTEDDLYYIQNYSLLLDIIILWRTLFAVIKRRGAY